MKYFDLQYKDFTEVKKHYLKLVKKFHPDSGGDEVKFKEMQEEFLQISKNFNYDKTEINFYNSIINEIIKLENINIDLIGSWIWISGNTYPHKEILKSLNFKFSRFKKAWYLHNGKYKQKFTSKKTLDELKEKWGCKNIKKQNRIVEK